MRKVNIAFTALCMLLSSHTLGCSATAEKPLPNAHTNSIGMKFVLIQAGSFMMGRNPDFEAGYEHEMPLHRVTISHPFYMGQHQVTQAQWVDVMGANPSKFKGRNNPVDQISWDDAQEFIKRLNAKEGHNRYRLPTEAEWEYAARAGTNTAYFFGDDKNELSGYAWYNNNSGNTTRPVGQKQPNAWGLYDVHGNVFEWVQDYYREMYYAISPDTDPKGPSSSDAWFNDSSKTRRVIRGGSYAASDTSCRLAYRVGLPADFQENTGGFRLALSLETATVAGTTVASNKTTPQQNPDVQEVQRKAGQGDARAQFNLGLMYAYGHGVPQDNRKAVEWYQKAADQGFSDAQANLGKMYENGHGVVKDNLKAVEWYQKAADQGYAKAQYNLGRMYVTGRGVAKDERKAADWYQKAANQGHTQAQHNLEMLRRLEILQ